MSTRFWEKRRENNPDLPNRHGQGWTDAEETDILNKIAEGIPEEEIARAHERTASSIRGRLLHIGYRMYIQNVPMMDIIIKTRVSEDDLRIKIDKERQKSVNAKQKTDEKVEKRLESVSNAVLLTVPSADLLDIKLLLHEIRDLLREQNRR